MNAPTRNWSALLPEDPKESPRDYRNRGPYKSHAPRPVPKFWRAGDALLPVREQEPVSELDWAEFLAGSLEG